MRAGGEAVIPGPHGNHTKRHALTMATELAREYSGDGVRAGAGLWLFEVMHAWQQHSVHSRQIINTNIPLLWSNTGNNSKYIFQNMQYYSVEDLKLTRSLYETLSINVYNISTDIVEYWCNGPLAITDIMNLL